MYSCNKQLVDLVDYLESVDDRSAGISILLIMILQSPMLTFPGYILMIYSGFKFGLVRGALINFLGLYASCLIGYRFGKWSSIDPNKVQNPKLSRFYRVIDERGIGIVSFLRILPLIPNNFTSIGSGLVGIPERHHSILSLFSIIQSFFWSFLGAYYLKSAISSLELNLTIFHVFILLAAFMFLIFIRRKLHST